MKFQYLSHKSYICESLYWISVGCKQVKIEVNLQILYLSDIVRLIFILFILKAVLLLKSFIYLKFLKRINDTMYHLCINLTKYKTPIFSEIRQTFDFNWWRVEEWVDSRNVRCIDVFYLNLRYLSLSWLYHIKLINIRKRHNKK